MKLAKKLSGKKNPDRTRWRFLHKLYNLPDPSGMFHQYWYTEHPKTGLGIQPELRELIAEEE
jgi:hypothetical protein